MRNRAYLWVVGFVVTVTLGGSVAGTAFAAGDANSLACPSATESSLGFSGGLPDCRAYELVSEADTSDLGNIIEPFGFAEGEHFAYSSWLPVPGVGADSGEPENFLASRTASGWQQTAVSVPQGEGPTELSLGLQSYTEGVDFTDEFADALVMSPFEDPSETPRLNQSTGVMVYEVGLGSADAVSTVSLPDSGPVTQSLIEFPSVYAVKGTAKVNGWGMFLEGASEDGSKVFFSTSAKLATAPGTPVDTHQASNEIYERTGGHTYLVGVLPDGEVPPCGASVGQGNGGTGGGEEHYQYGAISGSGANVVFQTPGQGAEGAACIEKETGVFLRDTENDTTRKLAGSGYLGRAGTGAGEEEKIFTTGGGAIYEYQVANEHVEEVASSADGLLAWSSDGSRVYYLGPEEGIYLYEEGAGPAKLIPGTEDGGYKTGYEESLRSGGSIETRESTSGQNVANMPVATPDGSELLFVSPVKLDKKYENCTVIEIGSGKFEKRCHYEVYLYNATSGTVSCVSCGSTPATGDASLIEHKFDVGNGKNFAFRPAAEPLIYSRPAENGGEPVMRAVFESTESLVPQDTNGTMDVYEWERQETEGCTPQSLGVGSVEESPAYNAKDEGCIFLLSSGTGEEVSNKLGIIDGSHLVGASNGLQDIYIQTPDALLPGVDNTTHIYDVRIDGGFPSSLESVGCEPGQCRTETFTASSFQIPASIAFSGSGNLAAAPVPTTKAGSLTKQQKLHKALDACKHKFRRAKRRTCESAARKRYRPKAKRSSKISRRGSKR